MNKADKVANELVGFINSFEKKEFMKDHTECKIFLKRTQWFLDLLNNPERKIPHMIHVTGTSGKGSVVQMIHEILLSAGKKVGSTYSPHPTTILERIRLGDKNISERDFIRLCKRMRRALEICGKISPFGMISFFEMMFCMTVDYFAQKGVKYFVIEVGLGGRYSASNVIPVPDISVITNIGLDHTDLLGNSKEKIAWEKAGILKSGTVFVSAEHDPKVLKVFKKHLRGAPAKKEIYIEQPENIKVDLGGTEFFYKGKKYIVSAIGAHQAQNAGIAIEVAKQLRIAQKHIELGLSKTVRPVCFEIVNKNPLIIIDGAHNTDKMRTTRDALKIIKKLKPEARVFLIIGISSNKRLGSIMRLIAPLANQIYTTQSFSNPFCPPTPPKKLAELAKKSCFSGHPKTPPKDHPKIRAFSDPKKAFALSKKSSTKHDIILVTGSIFLAGELR